MVPFGVMGPYKTTIEVLVKDNIPIKKYWSFKLMLFGITPCYKTTIRLLVQDKIPIKYRYWHKKDSEWAVPFQSVESLLGEAEGPICFS